MFKVVLSPPYQLELVHPQPFTAKAKFADLIMEVFKAQALRVMALKSGVQ